MIELNNKIKFENVYFLSSPKKKEFDEIMYLKIREKEGRIYSDDILMYLPEIRKTHPLNNEWQVRKATLKNLIKYFSDKDILSILDIGCGNGWLSNEISLNTNNFVTALDMNKTELLQGARVFIDNKKLKFIYGNIFEDIFPPESFDSVIFSSSIQYFNDFQSLIKRIFYFLKAPGEIHIVDSNFYSITGSIKAKKRTINYYKKLGFPEMVNFYNHRTKKELKTFNYKMLNKKSINIMNIKRIFGIKSTAIFPWILIIKN